MQPKFNSGLLFDSYNENIKRKIDGIGNINIFRAWGFPCLRQAIMLVSVFNLKKGETKGDILLSQPHKIEEIKVNTFTLTTNINNTWMTAPIPFSVNFRQEGLHYFKTIFHEYKSVLKIHFTVDLQKWPSFSKSELDFVKENPKSFDSIRADIHCDKCSHVYIFEETILEGISPPGGVMRFPKSGKYQCNECGNTIYLKDIQGQIRFSLKERISNAMKGK